MIHDRRIPLISATGSVRMGRQVAAAVGSRLGRTILELGGNNAVIVSPSADLELAVRAVVFGAIGTAGQRCTTIRRVLVHADMFDSFFAVPGEILSGDPHRRTPWTPRSTWGRSSMSKRSTPCRSP